MSAQHTPGPWTAPRHVIFGIDQHVVAVVGQDTKEPQTTANARLIAAAPEMLEALRAISEDAGKTVIRGQERGAVRWELVERARAAIAKAEGRARVMSDQMTHFEGVEYIPWPSQGCYFGVYTRNGVKGLSQLAMNVDGSPDLINGAIDVCNMHEAGDDQLLVQINRAFGTSFKQSDFPGR